MINDGGRMVAFGTFLVKIGRSHTIRRPLKIPGELWDGFILGLLTFYTMVASFNVFYSLLL